MKRGKVGVTELGRPDRKGVGYVRGRLLSGADANTGDCSVMLMLIIMRTIRLLIMRKFMLTVMLLIMLVMLMLTLISRMVLWSHSIVCVSGREYLRESVEP